jgi:hypothetical protein
MRRTLRCRLVLASFALFLPWADSTTSGGGDRAIDGPRPHRRSRHNQVSFVASTAEDSSDPPTLNPRLFDRYYQDDDLVIPNTDSARGPLGWFRRREQQITNSGATSESSLSKSNNTLVMEELQRRIVVVAPHLITVILGVGVWMKLALRHWSGNRKRDRRRTFAATWNTTTAAGFNEKDDSNNNALLQMMDEIEAHWQERLDLLTSDRAVLQEQLDSTMLAWNATQKELQMVQVERNETMDLLVAAQEQILASADAIKVLQGQLQARDVQFNATRQEHWATLERIQDHIINDTVLDMTYFSDFNGSSSSQNATTEQLRHFIEAVSQLQGRSFEHAESARQWQGRVVELEQAIQTVTNQSRVRAAEQSHRLKASMIAIVHDERRALMEDFQARMADLRSTLLMENATVRDGTKQEA